MKNAPTITTPSTRGRSLLLIESMANLPSPGRENVPSVSTAPPSSVPRSMPKIVSTGVRVARNACRTITTRSGNPFARAVRM